MESILAFAVGAVLLVVIGKLLALSIGLIIKLIVNAVIGGIILWIFNIFAKGSSLYLDITPLRALIVGIFGPFGILGILLLNKR